MSGVLFINRIAQHMRSRYQKAGCADKKACADTSHFGVAVIPSDGRDDALPNNKFCGTEGGKDILKDHAWSFSEKIYVILNFEIVRLESEALDRFPAHHVWTIH